MNKLILTTTILSLTLGACTQYAQPVCDREAIAWDKWGEPTELSLECLPSPVMPPVPMVYKERGRDRDRTPRVPTVPDTPTSPPDGPEDEPETPPSDEPEVDTPKDEPKGKPKGNNGFGNGDQSAPGNSGGNNNAENDRGGRDQRNHGSANSN